MALDIAGGGKSPRWHSWLEILRRRCSRMQPAPGSPRLFDRAMARYGLAFGSVTVATAATHLVGTLAEKPWAFPFYAAIVASAWFGVGPGCIAVLLASAAVEYFYASPLWSLHLHTGDLPWFASFVLCAVASLAWSTQRRWAQRGLEERVERHTADLRSSNAALQVEIGERQAAEEELRRSETLLAQGQQLSRTASWTLHWPAGDMRWSAQLFDILGLDHEGTSPSYGLLIERIHPEDRAGLTGALAQAIEARGEFSCEARIVVDGATKHVQALGEVRTGVDDGIELIGTIADVTERKQTEQALRDAEAELARTLRLATLAELAAAIAHEINQPLAAITANGSACVRSLAQRPPLLDNAREAASCIVADGHRAAQVIARIRALFNKEEPDQQPLDVNAVIRHVLYLSHGAIARQRVIVHADLAASAAMVMGDWVQLQQVVVNLVTNALEAMAEVVDRPRVLRVRSEVDGGVVAVTVEDAGCGLEPGQIARIFDSFYTTKPDGVGVGLAISRSIIEAHGGSLWAAPRTPYGAQIGFTLPAADAADEDRGGRR